MINDMLVINGIVHAWNLDLDNGTGAGVNGVGNGHWDIPAMIRDAAWDWHLHWNEPGMQVPYEVYASDWSAEVVATTMFLESDTDLACHHHLPRYSYWKDGLCSIEKNREMYARWPERFIIYAGVDPTSGIEQAIESLEEQVRAIPSTVGLKLYPGQINPYRTFRMDDETVFPLWQRARELGLRVIAVHKAMPSGPVPLKPYAIDDVDGAAAAFPDINWEIFHGGMAFAEETCYAIARFPNVFVNLEVTSAMLNARPEWFEDLMAQFFWWGGVEKIIWGDGGPFIHPQPLLQKFVDFEFSAETRERYRIGQVTQSDKEKMLAGNFVRMTGIDVDARLKAIADDEFARARAATGRHLPYANWRRIAGLSQDAEIAGKVLGDTNDKTLARPGARRSD